MWFVAELFHGIADSVHVCVQLVAELFHRFGAAIEGPPIVNPNRNPKYRPPYSGVRHSGGPLGLTITLTLTPGMADLRNGGPPNMGGLYLGLRLGLTIGSPSMAAPNLWNSSATSCTHTCTLSAIPWNSSATNHMRTHCRPFDETAPQQVIQMLCWQLCATNYTGAVRVSQETNRSNSTAI